MYNPLQQGYSSNIGTLTAEREPVLGLLTNNDR